MRMKYVMINDYIPFLFLEVVSHVEMKSLRSESFHGQGKITSAGFVQITMGEETGSGTYEITAYAFGESQSLGVKSKPQDSEIITRMLRG
jgi:hypothetical protein